MIKTVLKHGIRDCYFRLFNRGSGVRLSLCDESSAPYMGYNLIAITYDGLIQIDGISPRIEEINLYNGGCLIINDDADRL